MIVGIVGQTRSGKDTVASHLVKEHGFVNVALADPIKRFGYHVFGFSDEQLWGPSEKRNGFDDRFQLCEMRSSGAVFSEKTSKSVLRKVCDGGWFVAACALQEYGPEWLKEVCPDGDQPQLMESLCSWFASLGHKYPELSPRIMLQHLGSEWGREAVGENLWLDCMLHTADQINRGVKYDKKAGLGEGITESAPPGVVVSDIRFLNELRAIKAVKGKLVRIRRNETDEKSTSTGISEHVSETTQQTFSDGEFDVIIQNNKSLQDLYDFVDTMVSTL